MDDIEDTHDNTTNSLQSHPTLSFRPRATAASEDSQSGTLAPRGMEHGSMATWSLATEGRRISSGGSTASTAPGYTMIRAIGRGGYGEVWEARQHSLQRHVAIKRLKPDLLQRHADDTSARRVVVHEFELEACTTALLEHPNIVPVHDLGQDETGQPLLAMKLVKGRPWNELITEEFVRMAPDDFLARHIPILIDVTQAVAFAHSRGVVHRDLKPSQVMVGRFGEVLLMDWGLSVAFDPLQTPSSIAPSPSALDERISTAPDTASATNPAGTPAYMAPEQTESTAQRIGPWTDVYLLGATLFHLLAGHPPHVGDTGEQAMAQALLGVPCDPSAAAPRRSIPQELRQLVLQCTQPILADRLPSAEDFLARLQDFVSGSSRRRESVAITEAVSSEAARKGAVGYAEFADRLARLSRAQSLWPSNPSVAGLHDLTISGWGQLALENGDLTLARLQAERLDENSPRRRELLDKVKNEARAQENRARQRRLAIVATFVLLALVVVGGSLFTFQVMKEKDRTRQALGVAEEERDAARAARSDSEDLVQFILGDLRTTLATDGKLNLLDAAAEESRKYYVKQVDNRNATAADLYRMMLGLDQVSTLLTQQGNITKALECCGDLQRAARAAMERHPADLRFTNQLAHSTLQRATLKHNMGDLEAAKEGLAESLRLARDLVNRDPGNRQWSESLAAALYLQGAIQDGEGDSDAANGFYEESNRLREEILRQDPLFDGAREGLLKSMRALAENYMLGGRMEEAIALHKAAIKSALEAHDRDPSSTRWMKSLAVCHDRFAGTLTDMGEVEGAQVERNASLELLDKVVAANPADVAARFSYLDQKEDVAFLLLADGRSAEAEPLITEAIDGLRQLIARDPANLSWQNNLASSLVTGCLIANGLGHPDQAMEQAVEACEILTRLVALRPEDSFYQRNLWVGKVMVATVHMSEAEWELAVAGLMPLMEQANESAKADTNSLEAMDDQIQLGTVLAICLAHLKRADEAFLQLQKMDEQIAAMKAHSDGGQAMAAVHAPRRDYAAAILHAHTGNRKQTLACLERALADPYLVFDAKQFRETKELEIVRQLVPEEFERMVAAREAEM